MAARIAGARFFGFDLDRARNAVELAAALGGLKGPIMKVAQLLATIPDALPPEYVTELIKLQSQAPPMGWAFVKRRMQAELGADWQKKFASFEHQPAAAASLGQVHRARAHRRRRRWPASCNIPTCSRRSKPTSSSSACCLRSAAASIRRSTPREIVKEIGARMREELDYRREAKHVALYRDMLDGRGAIRVPRVVAGAVDRPAAHARLARGQPLLDHKDEPLAVRNRLAQAMFTAWWLPFSRFGVIHGDPHLGNYSVFDAARASPAGINLLDYGCIRIFPPRFVGGVVDLYNGLRNGDDARVVHAYETWGFSKLSRELIDMLNIWARFIYGPLMDDRVRTIADGVKPGEYGRRQAFEVHRRCGKRARSRCRANSC